MRDVVRLRGPKGYVMLLNRESLRVLGNTEWPQIKIQFKRLAIITFNSGHILENKLLYKSGPEFKLLFIGARCGFHGRFCTLLIRMQSRPMLRVAYLHRHSLPHHGFCLAVHRKTLAKEEYKLRPWRSLRNENQGVCGRVFAAARIRDVVMKTARYAM
jgi:hypothetical protein